MSILKLITPPSAEPITLALAKAHLRVDHALDDARITRHITEAREWVEQRTGKVVAAATWEWTLDEFTSTDVLLILPLMPVQSVTSIKYDDAASVEQTIAEADYRLVGNTVEAVVAWPTTADRAGAVRIQFLVGYANAAMIPSVLIAAIYLKLQEIYDGQDTSAAVHNLLTNYYTMVA